MLLVVRRFTVAVLVMAAVLATGACKRRRGAAAASEAPVQQSSAAVAGPMASMVAAADEASAGQLLRGFYGIEQNAWRWTAGTFAVRLKPPAGAEQKGATLQLKFVLPDVVVNKIQDTTLTAAIDGRKLAPERYTKAGEHVYSRDVPAAMLKGDVVVEFTLDKFLPASPEDARDLGVIMTLVGFEAKP